MASKSTKYTPIPGPRPWPIIGNTLDFEGLQSLVDLAGTYGPIYRMAFPGVSVVVANSVALLDELCDETRFHKLVVFGVETLRSAANDGLFTAHDGERNWEIAHHILLPVFGPTKIRSMLQPMQDICQQLCLKWARYGSAHPIDVAEDFTRLTLDTIGLCGMGHRFNSFYRDSGLPLFATSMGRWLQDSQTRSERLPLVNALDLIGTRRYRTDIRSMRRICEELVRQGRSYPSHSNDILNTLLNKADPRSGEKLSEDSIIDNLITFLAAGHETTSGLLSFTFYYLLKNEAAMKKVHDEVDGVIGSETITIQHLSQLQFINAVLRETLRLQPTASIFTVGSEQDELLDGQYFIKAKEPILVLLPAIQQDPTVYGDDAAEWRPERMLDAEFKARPANAWKPFGNGKRGCIGRAFAWQEALLAIASLFQAFTFSLADPNYELQIKEALTIKPDGFRMFAKPRRNAIPGISQIETPEAGAKSEKSKNAALGHPKPGGKPLAIFYGSNTGTCEALANRLAYDAAQHGFSVQRVGSLNSAFEDLPRDCPVVVITGSYDGLPPDNAKKFVDWISSADKVHFDGLSFAVFGCGHHDWRTTFYKTPKFIDERMAQLGAKRIIARGTANTADEDAFASLEDWQQHLWQALGHAKLDPRNVTTNRIRVFRQPPHETRKEFSEAIVKESKVITSSEVALKGQVTLELPSNMTYQPGDSFAVLPSNPRSRVMTALARFHLSDDTMIKIETSQPTALPTEFAVSAGDLFTSYVELSQQATPGNIRTFADMAEGSEAKADLERMASDGFAEVREKHISVLNLLELHPSIAMPIEQFLEMLPALRSRTYSISSAPRWEPGVASLTYSILDLPSYSGCGRFLGAASNYLAGLAPGAVVRIAWRNSNKAFHPPKNLAERPLIMIAAGSGIAPFRAFLQQRELDRREGLSLAPALLFFGCRGSDKDDLYRDEFSDMEANGVVQVYRAYSIDQTHPDARGCRYVQDRMKLEQKAILDLWNADASVFICGGQKMAEAAKRALYRAILPQSRHEDFVEWLDHLEPGRLVTEVFS